MPSDSATHIIDPPVAAPVGDGPPRTVGGYPLGDPLGPCPGGTAFRAVHPALQSPVEFRLFDPGYAADVPAFVRQMQAAGPVTHPHLATLFDAGSADGRPFAVLEAFPGADLESLVRDIGPMPAAIACAYIRQAALGLAAAHARGLVHGTVRATAVRAGPLVPSASRTKPDGSPLLRPGQTATAKVYDLGLVPHPTAPEPADDVAALGSVLYFLLAGVGRGPDAPPLTQRRPDVPAGLVELIAAATAPDPPSMAAFADRLTAFAPPADPPPVELVTVVEDKPVELIPAPPPVPVPVRTKSGGWVVTEYTGPDADHPPVFAVGAVPSAPDLLVDGRPSTSDGLKFTSPSQDGPLPAAAAAAGRRKAAPVDHALHTKRWIQAGVAFWLMAALLWFVLAFQRGCFNDAPEPTPGKKAKK